MAAAEAADKATVEAATKWRAEHPERPGDWLGNDWQAGNTGFYIVVFVVVLVVWVILGLALSTP